MQIKANRIYFMCEKVFQDNKENIKKNMKRK